MNREEIIKIIDEEVDAYLAMNGETGMWGESMCDAIGVDAVCEMVESGHGIVADVDLVEERLKLKFQENVE